jgi:hypothetical protein
MKRCILLLIASLALVAAQAQQTAPQAPAKQRKDTRPLADRIWFGGGVGLSFGSVTAIQLDPLVGYKVDTLGRFTAGIGASYWYLRDNRFPSDNTFEGYGYRPFLRYRFFEQAFAHAEFLHMNVEPYPPPAMGRMERIWVPHLLVGGGYAQPVGERSSIFFQVLFDVLQDPNSIYADQGPILGGGVGVGF